MTLLDLATVIMPHYPPTLQKDLKTSLKYLAQALNCPDPQRCPPAAYHRPLPDLYCRLEAHLNGSGKRLHTIRNTKNHVSRFFRLAEAHGLLSLIPAMPTPRFEWRGRPHRPGTSPLIGDGSYLRFQNWPPACQAAFAAFAEWATMPFVDGRDSRWRKRPITVESYRQAFQGYFGYLHHQHHFTTIDFNQLFDFTLVQHYIDWHINTRHQRVTVTISNFLRCLLALTNQYQPLPELRSQLLALKRRLPRPTPLYNKTDAWVPLRELRRIGESLWPKYQASAIPTWHHPERRIGTLFASHAGKSLMLRLWTYIPYRQRNVREMQLDDNLYRDNGLWRIRFAGEQLKVAAKQGKRNHFELPFPPDLVPTLEEYLTDWRPILAKRTDYRFSHVFLTIHGRPFTASGLWYALNRLLYSYTKQHWHPHIVRTVWATEWIQMTGDFYSAAIMLNDRLETTIKNYAHLLDAGVAERAYARLSHHHGALP